MPRVACCSHDIFSSFSPLPILVTSFPFTWERPPLSLFFYSLCLPAQGRVQQDAPRASQQSRCGWRLCLAVSSFSGVPARRAAVPASFFGSNTVLQSARRSLLASRLAPLLPARYEHVQENEEWKLVLVGMLAVGTPSCEFPRVSAPSLALSRSLSLDARTTKGHRVRNGERGSSLRRKRPRWAEEEIMHSGGVEGRRRFWREAGKGGRKVGREHGRGPGHRDRAGRGKRKPPPGHARRAQASNLERG